MAPVEVARTVNFDGSVDIHIFTRGPTQPAAAIINVGAPVVTPDGTLVLDVNVQRSRVDARQVRYVEIRAAARQLARQYGAQRVLISGITRNPWIFRADP